MYPQDPLDRVDDIVGSHCRVVVELHTGPQVERVVHPVSRYATVRERRYLGRERWLERHDAVPVVPHERLVDVLQYLSTSGLVVDSRVEVIGLTDCDLDERVRVLYRPWRRSLRGQDMYGPDHDRRFIVVSGHGQLGRVVARCRERVSRGHVLCRCDGRNCGTIGVVEGHLRDVPPAGIEVHCRCVPDNAV